MKQLCKVNAPKYLLRLVHKHSFAEHFIILIIPELPSGVINEYVNPYALTHTPEEY